MLLALLKSENIAALPVLVSTREHGEMIESYPVTDQFNHVMALVEYKGQKMVMDAGSRFRQPGYPREEALNRKGWVADETNPHWIDLPVLESGSVYFCNFKLLETGEFSGMVQTRLKGYDAVDMRAALDDAGNAGSGQDHSDDAYPNLVRDSVKILYQDDYEQPLAIDMKCRVTDAAVFNGDLLYIDPVLFPIFTENPFKMVKRDFPVDFSHPASWKYAIKVEIPQGYSLEENKKPLTALLPDNGGRIRRSVNLNGNSLHFVLEFQLDQTFFQPEEYVNLRTMFDLLIEQQTEPIVLKKNDQYSGR